MRIGVVCPYSFDRPGGVQNQVLQLADQLHRCGHDVAVLGPGCSRLTDVSEVPVTWGGRTIAIPFNGSVARVAIGPQVLTRTRRFLERGNFDILHIHEPLSPSYSFAALTLARGPIVATFHAAGDPSKLVRLSKPFTRPAMEKIRGAIAVSPAARTWEMSQLGGDPVVIPNGLDVARFARPVTADESGPIRLTFIGRLDEPRKGLRVLLRGLDELTRRLDPLTPNAESVVCTIVGGTTRPEKARKNWSAGLTDITDGSVHIHFVGEVDDARKIDILHHTDIAIAPNTGGESFGIVVAEAMAAGCAVLASDIPAFRAVLGGTGVLFRTGDSHDLCEKLLDLIGGTHARQRRESLAAAAAAEVARYDWGPVTTAIERVYDTVATGEVVTCRRRS